MVIKRRGDRHREHGSPLWLEFLLGWLFDLNNSPATNFALKEDAAELIGRTLFAFT
jgi:hypothetical protein